MVGNIVFIRPSTSRPNPSVRTRSARVIFRGCASSGIVRGFFMAPPRLLSHLITALLKGRAQYSPPTSKTKGSRLFEGRLPRRRLSGRLVDLGYRVRLLHTCYCFGPGHQHGRFGGLDGTSCGNSQRDGSHALIVRDISDDGEIVVTEAIPTTNEFAADGLARSTAHRFNSVLRLFELGG